MSAFTSFLREAFPALPASDLVVATCTPREPCPLALCKDHMGSQCHCLCWRRSNRPGRTQGIHKHTDPICTVTQNQIPAPGAVLQASPVPGAHVIIKRKLFGAQHDLMVPSNSVLLMPARVGVTCPFSSIFYPSDPTF
jgi:hypothetical protein